MRLLCLGDLAIGDQVSLADKWFPPGTIRPGSNEKIIFNWELPIGERVATSSSHPRLSVASQTPQIIEAWAPGFATLATNHTLDAGVAGLAKTIEELNAIGIETTGAGLSQETISEPLFWETKEGRLCILNWVFPETHPDWMTVPGVNCWPGASQANSIIYELKEKSDWLMVIVHWSDELFYYPRPEDRAIARQLVDLGVDIIIGHHPHVVRGSEMMGACPVFYSLGNFFFSDFRDLKGRWLRQAPLNRQSLGVTLTFKKGDTPKFETVSFIQTKKETILDPLRRSELRMQKLSKPFATFSDRDYQTWYQKKRSSFMKWEAKWQFGLRKLGFMGALKYVRDRARDLFAANLA